MLNKIIIIGHVARKPELKASANGNQYCKFSVATSRGYGDKRVSQWNDVVALGKQAENCCAYLDKGSVCCVDGTLVTETFTDKSGVKRKNSVIHAATVTFVSSKARGQSEPASSTTNTPDYSVAETDNIGEDEIPFQCIKMN